MVLNGLNRGSVSLSLGLVCVYQGFSFLSKIHNGQRERSERFLKSIKRGGSLLRSSLYHYLQRDVPNSCGSCQLSS